MIRLRNVEKFFQHGPTKTFVLPRINVDIADGEFVSIMGPSGSGKSTLMHLMGALDTPSTGRAVFDGQDLQNMSDTQRSLLRRTKIGFVFQAFNLLPTLTGAENVALPLLLEGDVVGMLVAGDRGPCSRMYPATHIRRCPRQACNLTYHWTDDRDGRHKSRARAWHKPAPGFVLSCETTAIA